MLCTLNRAVSFDIFCLQISLFGVLLCCNFICSYHFAMKMNVRRILKLTVCTSFPATILLQRFAYFSYVSLSWCECINKLRLKWQMWCMELWTKTWIWTWNMHRYETVSQQSTFFESRLLPEKWNGKRSLKFCNMRKENDKYWQIIVPVWYIGKSDSLVSSSNVN